MGSLLFFLHSRVYFICRHTTFMYPTRAVRRHFCSAAHCSLQLRPATARTQVYPAPPRIRNTSPFARRACVQPSLKDVFGLQRARLQGVRPRWAVLLATQPAASRNISSSEGWAHTRCANGDVFLTSGHTAFADIRRWIVWRPMTACKLENEVVSLVSLVTQECFDIDVDTSETVGLLRTQLMQDPCGCCVHFGR